MTRRSSRSRARSTAVDSRRREALEETVTAHTRAPTPILTDTSSARSSEGTSTTLGGRAELAGGGGRRAAAARRKKAVVRSAPCG